MCKNFCFFFFKQKTAYEIKECDWSSDVCSSDLHGFFDIGKRRRRRRGGAAGKNQNHRQHDAHGARKCLGNNTQQVREKEDRAAERHIGRTERQVDSYGNIETEKRHQRADHAGQGDETDHSPGQWACRQRRQNEKAEQQQRSGHDDAEGYNEPGEQVKQDVPDHLASFEQESEIAVERGQKKFTAEKQHRDENQTEDDKQQSQLAAPKRDDFAFQKIENFDLSGGIENQKENRQCSRERIGDGETPLRGSLAALLQETENSHAQEREEQRTEHCEAVLALGNLRQQTDLLYPEGKRDSRGGDLRQRQPEENRPPEDKIGADHRADEAHDDGPQQSRK